MAYAQQYAVQVQGAPTRGSLPPMAAASPGYGPALIRRGSGAGMGPGSSPHLGMGIMPSPNQGSVSEFRGRKDRKDCD